MELGVLMPLTPADAQTALREAVDHTPLGKRWIDRERLAEAIQGMIDAKAIGGQHVTVTASDTIDTGLATVGSATVSFEDDPVAGAYLVTCQIGDQAGAPPAGSIIIKTWYVDGIDPTAAPTFGKKVNWIAVAS